MIKKDVINDEVMYVRSKESIGKTGSRFEVYFNRKACTYEERGHFVIEAGSVVHNNSAPALRIVMSGSSPFLEVSGAITQPIQA